MAKCNVDSKTVDKGTPDSILAMLRFTPGKTSDAMTDLSAIITPPLKGDNYTFADTPTAGFDENTDLDGSYTQTRPLGRFLSFDVKRSLFSHKRPLEEVSIEADDSPATKRLKETENALGSFSLECGPVTDIKMVVHRLSTEEDLVADGTRPHTLPTIAGKHRDLRAITSQTMKDVLSGCYSDEIDELTIIDCRYPYEFDGGHIQGAVNLYTRPMIRQFLTSRHTEGGSDRRHVIIFHCEFSSERGPKLYRYLRSEDRALNKDVYPRLNFPEVYLLEGGYKAFFHANQDLCFPPTYLPMLHQDYAADLRHFRGKSKSWTAGDKSHLSRTSLRF